MCKASCDEHIGEVKELIDSEIEVLMKDNDFEILNNDNVVNK